MIEELLAYQECDADLRKIEVELSASEERKKAVVAKKYLDGVKENVDNLDARAKKLAEEFEKISEEQTKLKEQEDELYKTAESAEDENATAFFIKKIDELVNKMKVLALKASSISEELQAVIKDYVGIKNATKSAQTQYAENAKKYNELKLSKQADKDAIEKKLNELKKKVDPQLMDRYMQKRTNKIYPVIYEVKEKVCGACNMELSMSELNRLKNGEIIECGQCRRLLFMKADKN